MRNGGREFLPLTLLRPRRPDMGPSACSRTSEADSGKQGQPRGGRPACRFPEAPAASVPSIPAVPPAA